MSAKHQILIIGGGNAGISVASKLPDKDRSLDVAVVDSADKHYYQPAWTLVGSGVFDIYENTPRQSMIISKTNLI
jgi:sulfide:quinone oxidoreductase